MLGYGVRAVFWRQTQLLWGGCGGAGNGGREARAAGQSWGVRGSPDSVKVRPGPASCPGPCPDSLGTCGETSGGALAGGREPEYQGSGVLG